MAKKKHRAQSDMKGEEIDKDHVVFRWRFCWLSLTRRYCANYWCICIYYFFVYKKLPRQRHKLSKLRRKLFCCLSCKEQQLPIFVAIIISVAITAFQFLFLNVGFFFSKSNYREKSEHFGFIENCVLILYSQI